MGRYLGLLVILLALTLNGCSWHSMGDKKVSFEPGYANAPLNKNKALYIAVTAPFPSDAQATPDFISLQFSKNIRHAVRSCIPGDLTANSDEAIQRAKMQGGDYLVTLNVSRWKAQSISNPAHEVSMDVTVFDTETGATLNKAKIEATCYAMLMGLEFSPRECVRPQIDAWAQQTFGTDSTSAPQQDRGTFN